jgi:hydrogenase large subunit
MGAIYGGKLPHTPAYVAGGFTAISSAADRDAFGAYLEALISFIEGRYLPDAELLASLYDDYFHLGKGCGNLLSLGVFELDNASQAQLLLKRGRLTSGAGAVQAVEPEKVAEHVRYSWYEDQDNGRPPATADTIAKYPKDAAYSWLKAPRYDGVPYECGPLARMTVTGGYANGISVMDRHLARAQETRKIALAMREWLAQLPLQQSAFTPFTMPKAAAAEGLTEAPRGALGHWLQVAAGRIAKYQVVTPTCWNLSPRDSGGQRGPLEQALIGVPIANADKPIEALRVIHSFDPCLDCATHVTRVKPGAVVVGREPA